MAPTLALVRLSRTVDWRIVVACMALVSLVTLFLYRKDKRQAVAGAWRTPESALHFLELAGGWPAAFLAQRIWRHKIAKRIYQVNFWAIVLVHQYAALDYVQEWKWSRGLAFALARRVLERAR